ncbi:endonuclease domain-containing 1 protein-like [Ambystoma mexicanum]|uniref:endonuclease domain-containing 1 protein-like n=1 Tax=Ambystoma mexicanum TaxID=8296 RepID=UPI0037E96B03
MLHLASLLLVLHCHTMVNAEVLTSPFSRKNCAEFFYKNTEPKNLLTQRFARICQQLNRNQKKYRFATLYDRIKRTPVYSAYIYEAGRANRDDWFIEPQLVSQKYQREMEMESDTEIDPALLKESQAVNQDYVNSRYDRGHLNPCQHHRHASDSLATCTLTNIVPQNPVLNQGAWREYEESFRRRAANCIMTYVITGVIPGNNYISDGRVNIPGYIWSAACCTRNQGGPMTWAVIALNDREGTVDDISVKDLEEKLATHPKRPVKLFHEDCPRNPGQPFSESS